MEKNIKVSFSATESFFKIHSCFSSFEDPPSEERKNNTHNEIGNLKWTRKPCKVIVGILCNLEYYLIYQIISKSLIA